VVSKGLVPIPGTKRIKYLEQNLEAASIELTGEELARLEAIIPLGTPTGNRYDAAGMAAVGK
jgi:aryl-alcohol dehydrogenase-like predicted oxidoreductase